MLSQDEECQELERWRAQMEEARARYRHAATKVLEIIQRHGGLEKSTSFPGLEPLTAREVQVLTLIASGMSSKQIAERLGVTFKTAMCHRSRILSKLAVHNTAGLVRAAIRMGLVEP